MKDTIKNWLEKLKGDLKKLLEKLKGLIQWKQWFEKTKCFLKSKKGIACLAAVAAVILVAAAAWGGYEIWLSQQPKFHDLTIELGTDAVSIRDFMTEFARAGKVSFVTDPSEVDLNKTGETALTLKHGSREETVTLTIQDTTAPTAKIAAEYQIMVNEGLPEAKELVSDVQDASRVNISYLNEPVIPIDYRDETVTVVVEDASGNIFQGQCRLSFFWMPESYTLELGETLTKEMLLLNPGRDDSLLDQEALDQISAGGVGEYTVSSTTGAKELSCTVTVQDTLGPELVLKDVQRYVGSPAVLDDFLESVSDLSGVEEVTLVTELDVNTMGTYTVVVEAKDIYGNTTRAEATLWVTDDKTPPTISGAQSTLTVAKHSSPDFLAGVTANDNRDGRCKVTCDTSGLNLDVAGTYYITYRASDNSGNVRTVKRKVVVQHDAEDTAALVKSIADSLSNDPEAIRDYVKKSISYNHEWGGDDPVWYGFTTHGGNCYVHAKCLKAIFDLKGIESQLIWVTNKTHYWLIVKIGDGWKHIDATPSTLHGRYSLMNDAQRLETLSGRVWDTTQWPACN